MSLCTIQFFAQEIQKMSQMTVVLPEQGNGPFPVFYLLHGLSDDNTAWSRRTNIERYVAQLPLIVVMPDGGRGFYCDALEGPAYEKCMIKDVVGLVDRVFPTIRARSGRVIGGLSMGGYGAMKLAYRFPDMFCSAVSHSGALNATRVKRDGGLQPELARIFGPTPAGGKDDLFTLAETIDRKLLPATRFDCGRDDFLIEENRAFDRHLSALGIAHEYEEFPGSHEWGYWDVHVQEALAFHRKALGI